MSKFKRSKFNGGWFVEVETLKGKWVKIEWSSNKATSKSYADKLNKAAGWPIDIARAVENKRTK